MCVYPKSDTLCPAVLTIADLRYCPKIHEWATPCTQCCVSLPQCLGLCMGLLVLVFGSPYKQTTIAIAFGVNELQSLAH